MWWYAPGYVIHSRLMYILYNNFQVTRRPLEKTISTISDFSRVYDYDMIVI